MDGDQRGMFRKEKKNGAKENLVKSWGLDRKVKPRELERLRQSRSMRNEK